MDIAVVGGDRRWHALASLLIDGGEEVTAVGFETLGGPAYPPEAVKAALARAACIVLPAPAFENDMVCAPCSAAPVPARWIAACAAEDAIIFAGRPGAALEGTRAKVVDYLQWEPYAVANGELTAEGALEILMRERDRALSGARVLVTGYGRIGKLLCRKLRALGARLTVAARKPGDLAMVAAMGDTPVPIQGLPGLELPFDIVVNTVPAPVIGKELLRRLPEDGVCLELASRPGGFDPAAETMGIRLIRAPGLPGKYAPVTAGEILRDTIYYFMEEMRKRP